MGRARHTPFAVATALATAVTGSARRAARRGRAPLWTTHPRRGALSPRFLRQVHEGILAELAGARSEGEALSDALTAQVDAAFMPASYCSSFL